MKIDDIILEVADKAVEEIGEYGYVRAGHNGPYHDLETPCRNSAHWICLMSYLYSKTGKILYKDTAIKLADYILNQQLENGTFNCRNKDRKDRINGTIGAAWIIEGLVEAAKVSGSIKYYNAAVRAFNSQVYNKKYHLWERIEINDENLGFDLTYNHQLWFAAAGALISAYKYDKKIDSEVIDFLQGSKETFQVYQNGLIYHFVYFPFGTINKLKAIKKYSRQVILRAIGRPSHQYKEEGYHYFSLYGFAILHHYYPNHEFFQSKKFLKALNYGMDVEKALSLKNADAGMDETGLANKISNTSNIYAYSYNSPAFEIPFIAKEFSCDIKMEDYNKLISLQCELTYNYENPAFSRNTEDGATLTARLYELIRGIKEKENEEI
ncbi:hypothetical protein ACQRC3_07310 [Streptococcus alactolyticus]|uniref:hypothetical protein n=1 Tax=Streptococcus alactolyticus TaxID=29389 RepID=UPI003D044AE8